MSPKMAVRVSRDWGPNLDEIALNFIKLIDSDNVDFKDYDVLVFKLLQMWEAVVENPMFFDKCVLIVRNNHRRNGGVRSGSRKGTMYNNVILIQFGFWVLVGRQLG